MAVGQTLTLSEAWSTGLSTAGLGILIVFAVLFIIMVLINIMHYCFELAEKSIAKKKAKELVKKENEKETQEPAVQTTSQEDDEELIAVLTAAVAASLGKKTSEIQIKSFVRTNLSPVWNTQGKREQINNSF